MIRCIVAIDSKRGMADEHGIPWQHSLPNEVAYYHSKVSDSNVLMGYGTYQELSKPTSTRHNFVASAQTAVLRPGFELVSDARAFLQAITEDIWVIGGAKLCAETLDLIDELYLSPIEADFNCTKFFPEYHELFELASRSEPQEENGIRYRFEIWSKKP